MGKRPRHDIEDTNNRPLPIENDPIHNLGTGASSGSNNNMDTSNDIPHAGTSDDVEEATNLRAAGSSMFSGVAHETPITIPPTINYGMPDTWTTKLPFHGTFLVKVNENTANFEIRMNSIYDIIRTTLSTYAGLGSNGYSYQNSTGADLYGAIKNSNNQPAWRPFFASRYVYYTVLETDWRLDFMNYTQDVNRAAAIIPIYSGSVGIPTNVKYHEVLYWKGRERIVLAPTNDISCSSLAASTILRASSTVIPWIS